MNAFRFKKKSDYETNFINFECDEGIQLLIKFFCGNMDMNIAAARQEKDFFY